MADFTALNNEAQKLIDAQKASDDAIIADLRAQLAACQGSQTPAATVSATATAGTEQATLSWTVNNGPISGLTGWRVGRNGTDSGGAGPWSIDLAASATSQTFLSLVGGQTYTLSVAPIVNGTAGTAVTKTVTPTAASGGGTTTPPATGPASISDTGFTYSGTWNTATSEHWAAAGASASVTFTAGTGGSTFALRGKKDSSNGTLSVAIDGGTAVTVSESGTTTNNATIYTSGTLAAGQHTVVVTVATGEGSIQGADISNGTFAAPGTSTGGGTTTPPASGSNTFSSAGKLIGGPASTSNASGYAPPTADAFAGYTQVLSEDFNTAFSEGRQNGINVLGSGWFSYEGQQNGNYNGMYWDTDQISASGGVVTLRNTNAAGNCQALTPIFRDSANAGKSPKAQGILYGRTAIRMKARGSTGYKIAFLMWPSDPYQWSDGEIDFPEGDTVSPNPSTNPYTMTSNTHNVVGNPVDGIYTDARNVSGLGSKGVIDDGKWHTFVLEWDSNKIVFSMDGVVMNTVTNANYIPTKPMRWVLQAEPTQGGERTAANYIDIDWVAAYKKN